VEEYRLAAQALYRATRPNPSLRTPTSPRPPRSSKSTSHSSRSSGSSSSSSPHREAVEMNSRGSSRPQRESHTPGEVTQNEVSRSPDAQACDNDSPSTNPSPNHAASLTFNFQLSSFNSPPDTFNSHPP
jgi:hypothetical protein